jgi:hypothetical protein
VARASRRARPTVPDRPEIVQALGADLRHCFSPLDALREVSYRSRHPEEHPVHPRPDRGVWVIDNEREDLGVRRRVAPVQGGSKVRAVTGVLARNLSAG